MKKPNLIRRARTVIPLTSIPVYVFIAEDPVETFNEVCTRLFGLSPRPSGAFHASAAGGNWTYGLFLPARKTDRDDLGHEIDHLRTYIIDVLGHETTRQDEFGPRIAGHLHKFVNRQFKKAGLVILD